MSGERELTSERTDGLLRALMVLARTVSHVLETRVIESTDEPLSGSKLQLLHLLGQRGAQSPTQIARFLGVSKPAVTQAVDAMMALGFLRRQASREDRRGFNLTLTTRGKELFDQVREEQRHLVRNALREPNIDPDVWLNVLQEMSVSLAKSDRAFKDFCLQCGAYADGGCVLVGGDATCLFLQNKTRARRSRRAVSEG